MNQRMRAHEEDKALAHEQLREVGFQSQDIGQELLSSTLRDGMKAFPRYWLRWLPDVMACRPEVVAIPFLVEVKKGDGPTSNIAIEQDSLNAALLLARTGLPVIFLASYRSQETCEWLFAEVASLHARPRPYVGNGSSTPFVTVPKGTFRPLSELPAIVAAYTAWWQNVH